ncbi:Protein stum [Pseudolycoriella hygida]|uniref:Protein stum n=1 Tax=Pseudolycoriella hygida TaxID=35572 RepID=A0A9Q0NC58_9DIPT|nr:Protein stum [Pseudolycoriella hygida]
MRSTLSPTLRSRYDYYYSAISPGSTAINFYEHQNQSLFGDPVPPATDFLETLDSHLYGSLRRSSSALTSNNASFLPELPRPVPIGGNHLAPITGTETNNVQRIPLTDRRDSNETFFSYDRKRSSSSFSDDFRANLDNFRNTHEMLPPILSNSKRIFSSEPLQSRRLSNQSETNRQSSSSDSRDSNEWKRPSRPASKNIVELNHVGDAMVAVIQDSTTSSSDDHSPTVQRSATVHSIQEVLPCEKRRHSQPVIITKPISVSSASATMSAESESELVMKTKTRDLSPAIITQTIQTGSSYRINSVRQHKKTSFAILNELKPNQSRATSPSGRVSPFRGKGFKPSSRASSRPPSPLNDGSSSGDLGKPTVQFNTKTFTEKIGPSSTRGILLTRPSFSASYADLSYRDREIESFDLKTDVKQKTFIPSRTKDTLPRRPFSVLPDSSNTTPSPAPRRQFYNSTGDLYSQPKNETENPKSYHKGLLHVVHNGNISPSKIPRKKSLSSGTERGLERRRNSVSPKRRFSITTNNNILNDQTSKNSSIIDLGTPSSNPSRSGSRISKPTTLSPIIGTPNKDSEQSAQEDENNENLASPTKIPVRGNNSHLVARANSRTASKSSYKTTSREPSPGVVRQNNDLNQVSNKNQSNSSKSEKGSLRKKSRIEDDKTSKKSTLSPRISVRKGANVKSTNKEPTSTKKEPSSVKREPSNLKKPPASVKREGSNSKIGKVSLKRETSNLKREPSNLKREPSNLKREPSNLKREPSNLKRESSILKREKSTLKRQSSKLAMAAVLSKNNSDSALGKKLEKQNSFKVEKRRTISESDGPVDSTSENTTKNTPTTGRVDSKDKLVPLTKSNVVSMTTAAITAQPVQITTAVTNSVTSLDSIATNQELGEAAKDNLMSANPASIIEKSQKTLETIQKTVTEATDEIQKTIEENLTDLKSLENDIKNDAKVPLALEKKESTRTLVDQNSDKSVSEKTANSNHTPPTVITTTASPIEPNVSVVETTSNTLHPQDNDERISVRSISMLPDVELESANLSKENSKENSDAKNTSANESDDLRTDDRSENGDAEERNGCCKCSKCCTTCLPKFCMPCRRLKNLTCCKCCKRKRKLPKAENSENVGPSCWKRVKCCGKKPAKPMSQQSLQRVSAAESGVTPAARGKCALCLDKFFCCRKTNKIESTSDTEEEGKKCCCFPCRKSKKGSNAWVDNRRESILSEPKKQGCCAKICGAIFCCCKRKEPTESRRTSMNSKKQSIAPTLPPEDNRPKLDESLIEHASLMKGAIPVLPVCLAWLCLICNCFIPGSGTILSGIFCLCLGIPRFSQHDGARVRIGSFFINCIVGVAQAFTLLFCLVGWGWSIWWGTIMLKVAKKRRKLKLAEDIEQEEQTTSSNRTSNPPVVSQNHRDVEAA